MCKLEQPHQALIGSPRHKKTRWFNAAHRRVRRRVLSRDPGRPTDDSRTMAKRALLALFDSARPQGLRCRVHDVRSCRLDRQGWQACETRQAEPQTAARTDRKT
jgi:hypothetical protein